MSSINTDSRDSLTPVNHLPSLKQEDVDVVMNPESDEHNGFGNNRNPESATPPRKSLFICRCYILISLLLPARSVSKSSNGTKSFSFHFPSIPFLMMCKAGTFKTILLIGIQLWHIHIKASHLFLFFFFPIHDVFPQTDLVIAHLYNLSHDLFVFLVPFDISTSLTHHVNYLPVMCVSVILSS